MTLLTHHVLVQNGIQKGGGGKYSREEEQHSSLPTYKQTI